MGQAQKELGQAQKELGRDQNELGPPNATPPGGTDDHAAAASWLTHGHENE